MESAEYDICKGFEDDRQRNKICMAIRDMYFSLLDSLFQDPGDIPDIKLNFMVVSNPKSEFYVSMVMEKENPCVYSLNRTSNMLVQSDYSGPYNCICYHLSDNKIFIIDFEFENSYSSILRQLSQNFFPNVIGQITRHGLSHANIIHEKNLIISTAITQFLLFSYWIDVNFIVQLSVATYESKHTSCKIYKPHLGTRRSKHFRSSGLTLRLNENIGFESKNARQIRKLLEVSSEDLAFVVGDNQLVLGYSKEARKPYECEIRIKGYLQWDFCDKVNTISYKDGVYRIPKQSLSTLSFSQFFCNLNQQKLLRIHEVVQAAKCQRHGTVILISEQKHVQSEAKRLCKYGRGISIKPINLNKNLDIVMSITAIDGAVMMDTECNCMGMGFILDGVAIAPGNSARGARYNSTINYIYGRREQLQRFVGVIISEDGTAEVVDSNGLIISI